jgi:hypothetical protein
MGYIQVHKWHPLSYKYGFSFISSHTNTTNDKQSSLSLCHDTNNERGTRPRGLRSCCNKRDRRTERVQGSCVWKTCKFVQAYMCSVIRHIMMILYCRISQRLNGRACSTNQTFICVQHDIWSRSFKSSAVKLRVVLPGWLNIQHFKLMRPSTLRSDVPSQ